MSAAKISSVLHRGVVTTARKIVDVCFVLEVDEVDTVYPITLLLSGSNIEQSFTVWEVRCSFSIAVELRPRWLSDTVIYDTTVIWAVYGLSKPDSRERYLAGLVLLKVTIVLLSESIIKDTRLVRHAQGRVIHNHSCGIELKLRGHDCASFICVYEYVTMLECMFIVANYC